MDVKNPDLRFCVERRLYSLAHEVELWKHKLAALKHYSGAEINMIKHKIQFKKINCDNCKLVRIRTMNMDEIKFIPSKYSSLYSTKR